MPSNNGGWTPRPGSNRRARVRRPSEVGNSVNGQGCCPMVAAVRSVRRGKFRLARRYAVMSVRLMVVRFAWA